MNELVIPADQRFRDYTATAGQTVFPVAFAYDAASHVKAIRIEADGTETEYSTVSGPLSVSPASGQSGTATLPVACAAGDRVIIFGNTLNERAVNFGALVKPGSINPDNNRLLILLQELRRDLARAFYVPMGDKPAQLPRKSALAGKIFGFDENGNPDISISAERVAELAAMPETLDIIRDAIQDGTLALKVNRSETKIEVATAEDLKTLPASSLVDGQLYETRDRLIDGLGGGAVYKWKASSTETADDGNIIARPSGVGRFEIMRRLGIVDIREYKAKCDGSDDSAAVAAAMATGKHVRFPAFKSNIFIGTGTPLPSLVQGQTIINEESAAAFNTNVTLGQTIRQGELASRVGEGGIGDGFQFIGTPGVVCFEQTNSRMFRFARGSKIVNAHTAFALGNKDAAEASYYTTLHGDINVRSPFVVVGAVSGAFQLGEEVQLGAAKGFIAGISGNVLTLWKVNTGRFTVGGTLIGQTSGATATVTQEYRPGHMVHILNHAGNFEYDLNGEGAYDALSNGIHTDDNKHDRFDEVLIRDYCGRHGIAYSGFNARTVNALFDGVDLEGCYLHAMRLGSDGTTSKTNGQLGWGGIKLNKIFVSNINSSGSCISIEPGKDGPEYQDVIGDVVSKDENQATIVHVNRSAGTLSGVKIDIRGTFTPPVAGLSAAIVDCGGGNALTKAVEIDVALRNESATIPIANGVKFIDGTPDGKIPRPRISGLVTKLIDCAAEPQLGLEIGATSTGLPTDKQVWTPAFYNSGMTSGAGNKNLLGPHGGIYWYADQAQLMTGLELIWHGGAPGSGAGDLVIEVNGVARPGYALTNTVHQFIDLWALGTTFPLAKGDVLRAYLYGASGFPSGRGVQWRGKMMPRYFS